MDNNSFFKKMINAHSQMKFSIPNEEGKVFWFACTYIDKRGEIKIKVSDRHKHKSELYIRHDLSIGISGKNKDVPVYVLESVEHRMKNMKQFYDAGIPAN